MTSITIYGASDDLIEIEGDISEEWSPSDEGPTYLACSDGTVLRVGYDGVWHINVLVGGTATCTIVPAEGEDTDNYTDRATLTGAISWVVCGGGIARPARITPAGEGER